MKTGKYANIAIRISAPFPVSSDILPAVLNAPTTTPERRFPMFKIAKAIIAPKMTTIGRRLKIL